MECELCEAFEKEKYRVAYEDDLVFVMANNEQTKGLRGAR